MISARTDDGAGVGKVAKVAVAGDADGYGDRKIVNSL